MNEKTVNYEASDVARLLEAYAGANGEYEAEQAVVAEFADELGKSVASVRAKLQSEGVYNAKAKAIKGKATVKKDAIVDEIAKLVGVSAESFDSLSKANKTVLVRIYGRLKALSEAVE